MNIWANAVITQKGLALQAKLIEGTTLQITEVQIGAGYVTPGLLMQQTAVSDPKKTIQQVDGIGYPEEGKCSIKISITNDDVNTGYTAKQVGIYATDPDEGKILYFIAQAENNTGTVVPSNTEMPGFSAEWTFYFQYGNADNVSVIVSPSNTVSRTEMTEYVEEHTDPKGSAAAAQQAAAQALSAHTRDKNNPHGVTAEQVGADPTGSAAAVQSALQPLISALQTAVSGLGADVDALEELTAFPTAADLHAINSCKIVQTYSTTLNTPYKEGLTNAAHGLCIVSATGNFKTLVYMATSASRHIYLQSCNNGTWGPWETISVTRTFANNALYVGPTGNDTTGNGTQEKPFASLTKALSVIPKDLGGQTITINVAAGTYTETNPNINDFFGGTLQIIGDETNPPTFTSRINCDNCKCKLSLKYINAKAPEDWAAFAFSRCINVEVNDCKAIATTSGKGFGIYSSFLSTVYCHNCEINNCNYGVCCAWGDLYVSALTGSGNNYAATATQGGKIGIGTSVPGYTIAQYQTFQGGRIYKDGQINVPKY